MSDKAKRYTDLIDGVLELAARELAADAYDDLRREVSYRAHGWRECTKADGGLSCTYPQSHHGPHSWEKAQAKEVFLCARLPLCPHEGGVSAPGELCRICRHRATSRPMCKAKSGHAICWREEGHVENHDFMVGVGWSGATKPCPHDNVGCGVTRLCEVCKGAGQKWIGG